MLTDDVEFEIKLMVDPKLAKKAQSMKKVVLNKEAWIVVEEQQPQFHTLNEIGAKALALPVIKERKRQKELINS